MTTPPDVCQSINCDDAGTILVRNTVDGREWFFCPRCVEELCARPNWQRIAER